MRRTDDGIDPGRNLQDQIYKNSFFLLLTEILCPWVKNCKEAVGRS